VVLGDATKVKFVPTTGETRFTALQSGEVDLLVRNSTWTFSRDSELALDFVAVNYYDGQGFMVKKDLGVSSAKELDGATVCIQTGTTTELNLADFFKQNNISYQPVTVADDSEAQRQYLPVPATPTPPTLRVWPPAARPCRMPKTTSSFPRSSRRNRSARSSVMVTRLGRRGPLDLLRASRGRRERHHLGQRRGSRDLDRGRGSEASSGRFGRHGCEDGPRQRRVQACHHAAVGNYGEIFSRNIGEGTAINLARGLNALWTQGGLQYAPPFR
jgi:general L-amino acid transport system substrate-binding protein